MQGATEITQSIRMCRPDGYALVEVHGVERWATFADSIQREVADAALDPEGVYRIRITGAWTEDDYGLMTVLAPHIEHIEKVVLWSGQEMLAHYRDHCPRTPLDWPPLGWPSEEWD